MPDDLPSRHLQAAQAGDLDAYAAALTSIPVNRLNTIGKESAFQQAVECLVPIALGSSSTLERLTALSLMARADNTTQRKQPEIGDAIAKSVADQPPPLGFDVQEALKPDDRYYIGLAIGRSTAEWLPAYAARALVDEGGEPRAKNDVRGAFAALVFERAPTLSAAFRLIAAAAPGSLHEDPRTKGADLSRGKRMGKLLPAIEEAMRNTVRDSGDDLPEAFNAMIQALVFRHARPPDTTEGDGIAATVAEAAMQLLGTLVRTRFSAAVEVESYKTVSRLQHWLKTRSWPGSTEQARKRLGQSVVEAISTRAGMGKASGELLQVLVQLTGHRPTAVTQILPIADRPGVPSEVQEWLRAGGVQPPPRFQTPAAAESGLRDADTLLAAAIVRSVGVKLAVEGPAKQAVATVRSTLGLEAEALQLTQALNAARALANDIASVGQRRAFKLFGTSGEVVDVDPERHRQRDGGLIVTQQAVVEVPGIERGLPNGTTEVIVQAIVTPRGVKRK